jgi:hypothetical protein
MKSYASKPSSSYLMVIHGLFWEHIILHSIEVLEPITFTLKEFFLDGPNYEFLQNFIS